MRMKKIHISHSISFPNECKIKKMDDSCHSIVEIFATYRFKIIRTLRLPFFPILIEKNIPEISSCKQILKVSAFIVSSPASIVHNLTHVTSFSSFKNIFYGSSFRFLKITNKWQSNQLQWKCQENVFLKGEKYVRKAM